MDVNIATMHREEAMEQFELYREAVKRSHSAADRLMARAYKAMSEGLGVLNLKDALTKGGVDPHTWLPRMAAMRADKPLAHFQRGWGGSGFYSFSDRFYLSRNNAKMRTAQLQFAMPRGSFPEASLGQQPLQYRWTHSAPVPPIPPQFRPADALSKYVVLWEVMEWNPVQPPDDPILLKRLSGNLYAVLAQWDLTEIEKMVLGLILGA